MKILLGPHMYRPRRRLVPNSVTLDDLERRNRPNGKDHVKVVEDTPILSAAEM